jgi:hypothetical protein
VQADSSFDPNGLVIGARASNSVVKGLVVNRFGDDGITIGAGVTGTRIEGNFIGTDASGTKDRGNGDDGVFEGGASDNTVGGVTLEARNLISGNGDDGVVVFFGTKNTKVEGNLIGTKKDGTSDLGNSGAGVFINNTSNNTVGGATPGTANTIAFSGGDGVEVSGFDPSGNRILGNSIFSNGALGIDLNNDGPTLNDNGPPPDTDTGANNLQNKPNISSATISSSTGKTTVVGRLKSAPNRTFRVELFAGPSGDNEGKNFLGKKAVTTGADGRVDFSFVASGVVPVGKAITATATDNSISDTSEFSAPRAVVAS